MNPSSHELLIVILYKAGLRRVNEKVFKEIIHKAAEEEGSILERFKRHSQYLFSKTLDETLLLLVICGIIVGDGVGCYAVHPRSLEIYGKTIFDKLAVDEKVKESVEKVAKLIQDGCRVEM